MSFEIAYATFSSASEDMPPAERQRRISAFAGALAAKQAGSSGAISHNPDGSPYIPGMPDTTISISHCGNIAIASAAGYVHGIDLERIANVRGSVLRHFYSPGEQLYVSYMPDTLSRQEAFYTVWTRHEALAKATRISVFSLRGVDFCPGNELTDTIRFAGQTWYFASAIYDGHAISVCSALPVGGIDIVPCSEDNVE